jgi:hypothetical protein
VSKVFVQRAVTCYTAPRLLSQIKPQGPHRARTRARRRLADTAGNVATPAVVGNALNRVPQETRTNSALRHLRAWAISSHRPAVQLTDAPSPAGLRQARGRWLTTRGGGRTVLVTRATPMLVLRVGLSRPAVAANVQYRSPHRASGILPHRARCDQAAAQLLQGDQRVKLAFKTAPYHR